MVVIAGGPKGLASPRNDFERDFVLNQIRLAADLHRASRVILISHSDCGAYGGLAAFGGDQRTERAHHQNELQRASDTVKAAFANFAVECFFVDFEGLYATADR